MICKLFITVGKYMFKKVTIEKQQSLWYFYLASLYTNIILMQIKFSWSVFSVAISSFKFNIFYYSELSISTSPSAEIKTLIEIKMNKSFCHCNSTTKFMHIAQLKALNLINFLLLAS